MLAQDQNELVINLVDIQEVIWNLWDASKASSKVVYSYNKVDITNYWLRSLGPRAGNYQLT